MSTSAPWNLKPVAFGSPFSGGVPETKPNIVFIFADDQCFDTIAALGNKEIKTPNLDRLARQGTSFINAYNMGAQVASEKLLQKAIDNAKLKKFDTEGNEVPIDYGEHIPTMKDIEDAIKLLYG